MTFRTTQMSTATGELPGKKLSQEPGADTARAWGGRRPRSPPGRPGTASTSASLLLPHLQSQPDLHPAARPRCSPSSPSLTQRGFRSIHTCRLRIPAPSSSAPPHCPRLPLPRSHRDRGPPPPPPACGSIQQPPHSSHFPCPGQHFYSVQKQKQKQKR